jgi:AcrR family transcriptional regulator
MMEPRRRLVIEAALAEAEARGWYELRLHRVAERAGLSLPELHGLFRDADAIADAWFGSAEAAMLALPEADLAGLPPARRVEAALMRWFAHQAPHRRVVGGMLRAKMHLSHPHHWVPAVFHLSRLMHAALDAARLDARGLARQAEEVAVTAAFLTALARFPGDDPALPRTRRTLARGLSVLDRLPRAEAGRAA